MRSRRVRERKALNGLVEFQQLAGIFQQLSSVVVVGGWVTVM